MGSADNSIGIAAALPNWYNCYPYGIAVSSCPASSNTIWVTSTAHLVLLLQYLLGKQRHPFGNAAYDYPSQMVSTISVAVRAVPMGGSIAQLVLMLRYCMVSLLAVILLAAVPFWLTAAPIWYCCWQL
jgi:hypothetical protein